MRIIKRRYMIGKYAAILALSVMSVETLFVKKPTL
jgi:hypothetical protein